MIKKIEKNPKNGIFSIIDPIQKLNLLTLTPVRTTCKRYIENAYTTPNHCQQKVEI